MSKIINYRSLVLYLTAVGVILVIFVFLFSVNLIGYSVKNRCAMAQELYPGDCVEALNSYLDDERNSYYRRNQAIWALGQIGDERSRSVLEKYYTGYNGERIDRDEELAQQELERAIGYLDGNLNITTFFWRFNKNLE